MNKKRNFGIALLVTAALLVLTTGVAFAVNNFHGFLPFRSEDDMSGVDRYLYGYRGGFGSHMRFDEDHPPMMSLMIDAIAEETGLTAEEIYFRLSGGERLFDIALDLGMRKETYLELMDDVREGYLSEALENGGITEEQFQWMIEHQLDKGSWNQEEFSCPHYYDGESTYQRGTYHGMGRQW